MKAYIDLGAYDGDSIIGFMHREDSLEFEIYGFEPNPNIYESLVKNTEIYPNIVQLDTGAAWIKNEIREFAVDVTENPMGSTLMPGKKHIWESSDKVEVHCFDFSEWIKQFEGYYIIIKMDIEGAEFPVLTKLIKDGTIKFIDELWVEFHQNKVTELTSTQKEQLAHDIEASGVRLKEWH